MNQQKTNKQAFTLVELIVVILILVILWTIAFISLQWYSKDARDSTRLSNMSAIKTSLELFHIDAWKYPDPTEAQPVTFSWWLAWYQWIFGNSTFINVDKLNSIPKDPLTDKEYSYSVLNTKQEFELSWILEWDEYWLNELNTETYAAEKTAKAMIRWTYNWVSLRINTNATSYVLAIPSITTSIDLSIEWNRTLETIIPARQIVISNYQNLPSNYVDTIYNSDKATEDVDYKITKDNLIENIVVFEWDLDNLTPTVLITNLQEAYSWTTVKETDQVNELMSIDPVNGITERIDNFWVNFINHYLWWTAETRIYNTCAWIAHNTTKAYYTQDTVSFTIWTCNGVKQDYVCIDWTWKDGNTVLNPATYPYDTCSIDWAVDCTILATPVSHGNSLTVYSQDSLAWDAVEECTDWWIQWSILCTDWTESWDTWYWFTTCAKWIANNCLANASFWTLQTYNVPALNHAETFTGQTDVLENNGTYRYTMDALCNNWTLSPSETWPVLQNCDTNYTASWSTCSADSQTVACWWIIPSNATETTSTWYLQTWNGTIWDPTILWWESQATCDFNCDTNYTWNSWSWSCDANTQAFSCAAKPVTWTIWNTVDNYTQTWDWSDWLPIDTVTTYNPTSRTDQCRYTCATNYTWGWTTCEADTQSCSIDNWVWTQLWNGTSWWTCIATYCYGWFTWAWTSACTWIWDMLLQASDPLIAQKEPVYPVKVWSWTFNTIWYERYFTSWFIPIDTTKTYKLTWDFQSQWAIDSRLLFWFAPYDINKENILPQHVYRIWNVWTISSFDDNTITTDTTLVWWNGSWSYAYQRILAFYYDWDTTKIPDITVFKDDTYSTVIWEWTFLETSWTDILLNYPLSAEIVSNIIPWVTKVWNHSSWWTYIYTHNIYVPNTLTTYNSADMTWEAWWLPTTQFRIWTKYVKVLLWPNYGQDITSELDFNNIHFRELP